MMTPKGIIKLVAAYMVAMAVLWSTSVWLLELPSPLGTETWGTWLGIPLLIVGCAVTVAYLVVTFHQWGLMVAKGWLLCGVYLSGYALFASFNDPILAGGNLAILVGYLWFIRELDRPEMKGAYTAISALHKQMWNALSGQQ
ncbi:hypothetical protein [Vibrio parahaemolyticus]|uniref:hypothetical protein n=1 Tax=Vibrio parahaemolyticus TaxID=670 RepID=UPI00111E6D87|nr:hypothetical protein [Vibrio parahaemolyticus]TOA68095.1 hypothetical protein CGK21_19255 [Vibrio parahaemolyticus]